MQNVADVRINSSAIREELPRILTSSWFDHSPRMQGFLSYVVEETLTGRSAAVKEYAIALNVYAKQQQFDPRTDSAGRGQQASIKAGKVLKVNDESHY
jgi:hypothetical protein